MPRAGDRIAGPFVPTGMAGPLPAAGRRPAFAVRVQDVVRALGVQVFGGITDLPAAMIGARVDLVLWMPLALGLGIGIYFALSVEPGRAVLVLLGAAGLGAGGLWVRGPEALRFPAALLAICLLGLILAALRSQSVAAPVLAFRLYGPVEGRVVALDRSARDQIRLTLDRVTLGELDPVRTPGRVRVTLQGRAAEGRAQPHPGERVMLTANLTPPPGPAEPAGFDFRRFAWFEGLGAVGYTRSPVLRIAPADPGDLAMAGHRMRMRVSAAMQAQMPGQAGAVAAALMTGDRSGISEQTNDRMRAANLYHIVSISGLHMGMLAGFVFGAIRYGLALLGRPALVWPAKKIAAVAALAAASLYLWIAGPQVATERAYLMAAVMLIAVLFDRRAISLRSVALAASALLMWQPESLTSAGFQMSFAATTALILAVRPWGRIAPRLPALLRPVAMLVVTSLLAGFATAPIAAAQFHRMSEYGLIANLLAVPVMGVLVMPAGVIAALLAPLGLAAPALWVMEIGTRWMLFVAEFVAGLDGATTPVMQPPGWVLPTLALGALGAVLARGAGRSLGLAVVLIAGIGWQGAARPAILIAPEGALVGVLTSEGRVLSKPANAFVAESWLAADGDEAGIETAASRPGFGGPRGAREGLFEGQRVVHLSGKAAPEMLGAACAGGALVVLAAEAPVGDWSACALWDQRRLAASGAVALWPAGRLETVQASAGDRPWTGHK